MIEALRIYCKQRLNLAQLMGAALFLLVLSLSSTRLDATLLIQFGVLFCVLVLLRLYDDLMQKDYDEAKPNRDYLKPEYYTNLRWIFLISAAVALLIFSLIDLRYGLVLGALFLINHLVYLIFLRWRIGAWVLPLFKYPVLYCCVQCAAWDALGYEIAYENLFYVALSILSAFIAFDVMDENRQSISLRIGLIALSFGALTLSHQTAPSDWWIAMTLFLFAVFYAAFNLPYRQYLFLFLLLLLKISLL